MVLQGSFSFYQKGVFCHCLHLQFSSSFLNFLQSGKWKHIIINEIAPSGDCDHCSIFIQAVHLQGNNESGQWIFVILPGIGEARKISLSFISSQGQRFHVLSRKNVHKSQQAQLFVTVHVRTNPFTKANNYELNLVKLVLVYLFVSSACNTDFWRDKEPFWSTEEHSKVTYRRCHIHFVLHLWFAPAWETGWETKFTAVM